MEKIIEDMTRGVFIGGMVLVLEMEGVRIVDENCTSIPHRIFVAHFDSKLTVL